MGSYLSAIVSPNKHFSSINCLDLGVLSQRERVTYGNAFNGLTHKMTTAEQRIHELEERIIGSSKTKMQREEKTDRRDNTISKI